MTGQRFRAVHEQDDHAVHVEQEDGGPVATYKAPNTGNADEVLRANGWRRVTGWSAGDDVDSGSRVCWVESLQDVHTLDLARLDRDQSSGRERRSTA